MKIQNVKMHLNDNSFTIIMTIMFKSLDWVISFSERFVYRRSVRKIICKTICFNLFYFEAEKNMIFYSNKFNQTSDTGNTWFQTELTNHGLDWDRSSSPAFVWTLRKIINFNSTNHNFLKIILLNIREYFIFIFIFSRDFFFL